MRRVLAAALLALGLLSPLAVAGTASGVTLPLPFVYDGQQRELVMYVPPRLPQQHPAPVLLVLHGLYGDPAAADKVSGLRAVADAQGVVLAYPAGLDDSWNAGRCCGPSSAKGVDDVGFLVQSVDVLASARRIDRTRVFVAGFSNGGMMALRAACDRPDVFAAAASVGGTLETPCAGSTPVSALLLSGGADTTVPYAGQAHSAFLKTSLTSVPQAAATLAERSGCAKPVVTTSESGGEIRYDRCRAGARVQVQRWDALGHAWPPGGGRLIWAFLSAQAPGL